MILRSPAFEPGASMPACHTCEGEDVSPPLAWSDVPAAARSLVLVVEDPDAPDPRDPRMTWVHWLLYNLPPGAGRLEQDVRSLPPGTREGLNDWKRVGYGGPCPPIGRHRYFHRLYALDVVLPDLHHPTRARLDMAMQGHVIAQAELLATYQKRG